ncbi:hypothetical protein EG329_000374 [Mollisiaceae sp. DMI_Dod_QoI]|nr:hypothetical protein EG329_000374 [Helotiales sp. DMI_Dod_QoI]
MDASTISSSSPSLTRPATAPKDNASSTVGKLIVGIDVGTTQCAVATAELLYSKQKGQQVQACPRIKLFEGWLGFYMNYKPTPRTAMYYQDDDSPLTGNDLEQLFADVNPKVYRPDRLIRLWKLMFHHHQNKPIIQDIQARIQKQLDKLGKTADDLMKDWARLLLDQLFTDGSGVSSLRQNYENFDKLDLELVIAVPPGRSTIAHEQVLQAFVQGPISSTAVSLESEPAALFRNWVHEGEDDQNWIVGKRYLIADGGGGTCCFVRFRLDSLEPLRFTQEFSSESVVCGAETISDLFEKLIATKIADDCLNRDWWIGRMRNKFDAEYKLFVGGRNKAPVSFLRPGAKSEHDFITVTADELQSCFAPCIAKLGEGIRRQLAQGEPVDYIVLGGGLFQNMHVLSTIREEFSTVKILETSTQKGAVAKGAVLSKIYDNFTLTSEITRTRANVVLREVTPQMKKSKLYEHLHIRTGDHDQKQYFWAAEYLVKQGDKSVALREISTESSAKDARVRYVEPGDTDLEFSEKILTFDYRPGSDSWAAYRNDGTWMNEQGKQSMKTLIPEPEHVDIITWTPLAEDTEADLNDLDTMLSDEGIMVRVLRYSIQMQIRETGTKYWAKMWSSEEMKRKTGESVWSLSQPVDRKPLFTPQAISQSLANSFDLDTGDRQRTPTASHVAQPSRSEVPVPSLVPTSNRTNATMSTPQQPRRLSSATRIQGTNSHLSASMTTSKRHQDTESGNLYSPGAMRSNGGCWTCLLRHNDCSKQTPKCSQCDRFGLECDYKRPRWWYDKELKEEQKEKNKLLVEQNRAGLSSVKNTQPQSTAAKASGQASKSPNKNRKPLQQLSRDDSSTSSLLSMGADDPIPSIESLKRSRDRDQQDRRGDTPQSKKARLNDLTHGANSIPSHNPGDAQRRKSDRAKVQRMPAPEMRAWGDISEVDIETLLKS